MNGLWSWVFGLCAQLEDQSSKDQRSKTKDQRPSEGTMDTFFKDVRYGWRGLIKHPGFTAIVVITLALGIGASTAIFSVVNSVMLRRLPYPNAERMVAIQEINREGQQGQVTGP